jgi:hypothetical protein
VAPPPTSVADRRYPRGLLDPDESVRRTTLSAAGDAGIEIPATDLHTVVLTDQSPPVCLAARASQTRGAVLRCWYFRSQLYLDLQRRLGDDAHYDRALDA